MFCELGGPRLGRGRTESCCCCCSSFRASCAATASCLTLRRPTTGKSHRHHHCPGIYVVPGLRRHWEKLRSRDNCRSRQFQRQVVDLFSIGAYEVKSTMHVMSPYSPRHMAIMQNDSTTFTSALLISTLTPITLLNILFINPMRTLLKQKEAPSWM